MRGQDAFPLNNVIVRRHDYRGSINVASRDLLQAATTLLLQYRLCRQWSDSSDDGWPRRSFPDGAHDSGQSLRDSDYPSSNHSTAALLRCNCRLYSRRHDQSTSRSYSGRPNLLSGLQCWPNSTTLPNSLGQHGGYGAPAFSNSSTRRQTL